MNFWPYVLNHSCITCGSPQSYESYAAFTLCSRRPRQPRFRPPWSRRELTWGDVRSCTTSTTITFAYPVPSRPITSNPVLTTARRGGLKRGCRGRREHSVNAALDFLTWQLTMTVMLRWIYTNMGIKGKRLSAIFRLAWMCYVRITSTNL